MTLPSADSLSRAGYVFAGWNTAADGSGTTYAAGSTIPTPADSSTLYATWTALPATITLNAGQGTLSGENTITSATGQAITLPDATQVTRTGYTLTGWADAEGTLVTSPYTVPAGGASLTAQWVAQSASIQINANGATGSVAPLTGVTNGTVTPPGADALTREGYTFTGWNTAADGSGTSYAAGESVTLSATSRSTPSGRAAPPPMASATRPRPLRASPPLTRPPRLPPGPPPGPPWPAWPRPVPACSVASSPSPRWLAADWCSCGAIVRTEAQ